MWSCKGLSGSVCSARSVTHWLIVVRGATPSTANKRQSWIPVGSSHGFAGDQRLGQVVCKAAEYRHPEDERSLLWKDSTIGIEWPPLARTPHLAPKDVAAKRPDDTEACSGAEARVSCLRRWLPGHVGLGHHVRCAGVLRLLQQLQPEHSPNCHPGAAAGSLFVFKRTYRAVLTNHPNWERQESLIRRLATDVRRAIAPHVTPGQT